MRLADEQELRLARGLAKEIIRAAKERYTIGTEESLLVAHYVGTGDAKIPPWGTPDMLVVVGSHDETVRLCEAIRLAHEMVGDEWGEVT